MFFVNVEEKMSENSVFYLETKSVVDSTVKMAVVIGHSVSESGAVKGVIRGKVSWQVLPAVFN